MGLWLQELKDEFDKEKDILEAKISYEKEELIKVREDREKGEQQLEQLSQELDTVDLELVDVKKTNVEKELQMKESYERKVSQIELRINKLRVENNRYSKENVRFNFGGNLSFNYSFIGRGSHACWGAGKSGKQAEIRNKTNKGGSH